MSRWPSIKIGDACDVIAGGTPQRSVQSYWDGNIPWVKISDMLQGCITNTEEKITQAGLDGSAAKILPVGTLLVSIFATIGRTAVLGCEAATNQAIVGVIPKEENVYNSRFLQYCLQEKTAELVRKARGVAQLNINGSVLKSTEIPLPPLDEQKRIAAILDAADTLRAKRRQSIAQLDALIQSTFLDLFGDPVTNPMGWKKVKIGDLVNNCRTWNPQKSSADFFDYIDLSSIDKDAKLITEVERYACKEAPSRARQIVESGDVLVATVRPNLNGVAMAKDSHHGMTASTGYCVLRPDLKKVAPEFLFQWAKTKAFIQKMIDVATGANYPAVSDAKVKASLIPLPALPLQQKFAAIVESIERQKTTQRTHLAELDALFASLQHRAFRGEL